MNPQEKVVAELAQVAQSYNELEIMIDDQCWALEQVKNSNQINDIMNQLYHNRQWFVDRKFETQFAWLYQRMSTILEYFVDKEDVNK